MLFVMLTFTVIVCANRLHCPPQPMLPNNPKINGGSLGPLKTSQRSGTRRWHFETDPWKKQATHLYLSSSIPLPGVSLQQIWNPYGAKMS